MIDTIYNDELPVVSTLCRKLGAKPQINHNKQILLYCISGEVEVLAGDFSGALKEGELCLIDCGEVYCFRSNKFNEIIITEMKRAGDIMMRSRPVEGGNERNVDSLKEYLMLMTYLMTTSLMVEEDVYYCICEKLLDLAENVFGVKLEGSINNIVQEVIKSVGYDFSYDIKINQYAKKYKISSKYLSELLKKAGGGSFLKMLTRVRCMKADSMLLTTREEINVIAQKCGFNSVQLFIKHFKKYSGETPLQRRKTYQGLMKFQFIGKEITSESYVLNLLERNMGKHILNKMWHEMEIGI